MDAARLQLSTKSGDLKLPYERLLAHVFDGDQTLFVRDDEIEVAWQRLAQLVASWAAEGPHPHPYDCFSQGPEQANQLVINGSGWERIK